jgi:uncharacterized protein (TIGR02246 family)
MLIRSAMLTCCLIVSPVASVAAAELSLQARVQHLEDVESIRGLLERYIELNESRDYPAYSQLFARDGELVLSTTRLKGPAAIRDFLEANFGGAKASAGPSKGSAHLVTNVRISVDGDKATSVCRWTLVSPGSEGGRPVVTSKGRYEDKLVREDGRWKFKERSIVTDPAS